MAETVKSGVTVTGLRECLNAINAIGPDANRSLRACASLIAASTASEARRMGAGLSAQQALAASSIRKKVDRVPTIIAGGARKVGHRNAPVGAIFFGAEFGGQRRPTTQQFRPFLGQTGYFLWPTIRNRKQRDIAAYQRALDGVCARWARGG